MIPARKPRSKKEQSIRALKAENKKLHMRIVKLKIRNMSLENRIDAIEKEHKERMKRGGPSGVSIILAGDPSSKKVMR